MKSGYIIANQHAEFLALYQPGPGIDRLAWTLSPGRALVFKTRGKCRKVMKAISSPNYTLWEMTILETKTQYRVGCSCVVLPPWFSDEPSINDLHPAWIHAFEASKKNKI